MNVIRQNVRLTFVCFERIFFTNQQQAGFRRKMHLDHKEWFIEAPWGRIAVIAWGDSINEPVIYCHGKQDTAAGFHPLAQLLPRDKYYVGFDLPGNGLSDPFPPGLPISVFDFTFALKVLVDHFRWKQFIYIGHSLGTQIGKYYNFAYPSQMTRIVDLDPIPAYYTVTMDELPKWYYKFFFKYFDPENYAKLNGPPENSPTYTYEEAFELLKKNRNLTTETTKYVLDRNITPAGDGRFRFSIDQRMKIVMRPPFTPEYTEKLYKSIKEPLLTVLAQGSVDMGMYPPYVMDKTRPNYFVEVVEGTHDVHIYDAKKVAPFINEFLAKNFDTVKAKL